MKKILIATLLTSIISPAFSADSVDISVIGTISAASCTPTAGGGGVVDYGFIQPNSLSDSGPTVLDVKTVSFSVACDAPANVALRAYSNRNGTVTDVTGPENITGTAIADSALISAGLGQAMPYGQASMTQPTVAGLGTANGDNIGGYLLNLPPVLVSLDGIPATAKYFTYSTPTSTTGWNKEAADKISNNGHSLFSASMAYFSYSTDADSTSPSPFTELMGTLLVQGYITDKSKLNFSSPINLDGSATIELYYF